LERRAGRLVVQRPAAWKRLTGIKTGNKLKKGAVALRKMIQDIVGINHSSILYLIYILLSATAPFPQTKFVGKRNHE